MTNRNSKDYMRLLMDIDKAKIQMKAQIDRWEKLKVNYALSVDRQNSAWRENINHGRWSTIELLNNIFQTSKPEETFHEIFGEFFTDNPPIEKILNEVILNLNSVLDKLENCTDSDDSSEGNRPMQRTRFSSLLSKLSKR